MHAAARHLPQRLQRHLQARLAAGAAVVLEQRGEHRRPRELRRGAEPAVLGIEGGRQAVRDRGQQIGTLRGRRGSGHRATGHARGLAHRRGDAGRGRFHVVPPLPPVARQEQQQLLESRPAVGRARREVGAGVERQPLRGEEHRHRPAAGTGDRLHHAHVDAIHVGPLLAVDLHVDEVLVHHRRDRIVLERFVLHDVAPVAGGVADRDEQRLVGGGSGGERLLAPRVPVDRVEGVLQQVGTALLEQTVRTQARGTPTGDERLGAVGGDSSGGIGHGPRYQDGRPAPTTRCSSRNSTRSFG